VSAPPDTAVFTEGVDEWPAADGSGDDERPVSLIDPTEDRTRSRALAVDSSGRILSSDVFALVYRQMRSLAGGRADFDDLVQIAAEQVLRSLASFEGRCKLSTWTHRICYVTVLRHERWYRRWLRRFTLTERGELDVHAAASEEPTLEEFERIARLRKAVARLSPKRRTVVVLHDLEGRSIDEIAGIVAAKPLTVRSRLRDGRRNLARILCADPYFGDEACRPEETER
jgi:RNA polymerase sigma-70 factor (ECF subfamily)